MVVDFPLFDLGLDRLDHLVPVRAEDIDERDFISLFIGADGVVQGHVFAGFFQGTQVHEDFISKVNSAA